MKPAYGRVSRYGLIAFASSLDQIGPMTRDVRDTALLLQAIAGHDPRDSTSANVEVPDYLAALDRKSTRLNSSHANISYAAFCLHKYELWRSYAHTSELQS